MHISSQKEAIWNTLFGIFERWRGPQTSRGPGKLPPLPPSLLSTGLHTTTLASHPSKSFSDNESVRPVQYQLVGWKLHRAASLFGRQCK